MPDRSLTELSAALAPRYRLNRELGRGGMATVYLAWDVRHDRSVALKVLHPEIARTIGTDRFLLEIKLSARLQHPHILTVLDSGEAAGQFWFTMPFIEGESLAARLAREGALPLDDALRIAAEVADGLQFAHSLGVLHRDIKPGNILLSGQHALIADFGIARAVAESDDTPDRLTETGMTVGTPEYMSPEQAAGERTLDARSDIYALGCVVYEMLAGEPPFTGPTPRAILAKRLTEPVPRLGILRQVPAGVESAITRALARSPADRPASAAEFSRALMLPAAPSRRAASPGNRWLVGLAAAALLIGAFFTLRRSATRGTAPIASAAVLPLADLSSAHDQIYFSDGLTEELTSALSRLPGFKVAARNSAFQFRGTGVDPREVGRKLGVGTVLEGSVRRTGDQLHVSVQLVSTSDGFELWSDTYDRQMTDVFAVQSEIARAVASALRVRLNSGQDSVLSIQPTTSIEAYDLYLQGVFALNQRTTASLGEAIRFFEAAVARDSGLAKAWAGLADSYVLLPVYSASSPRESWPKGKAAAQRAIALNPKLADAHTALAYGIMLYDWDWAAAEEEFRTAIAADPQYPTAHHWYADFLAGRNRLDESLHEMQQAHAIDPLSRIITSELAWIYNSLHRTDEADSAIAQVLRLDAHYPQAFFVLGQIRMAEGRTSQAIAAFDTSLATGGFYGPAMASLIAAHAAAGDRTGALVLLDSLKALARHQYVAAFALALAYTGLRDRDQAFHWLNQGIAERDALMPENFFQPEFEPLKSDPRYQAVVDRLTR